MEVVHQYRVAEQLRPAEAFPTGRGHVGCWLSWFVVTLLGLVIAGTVVAAPITTSNRPDRPNKIVYGGDEHFPPYEYLDDSGKPQGLNVELIRAVGRAQGIAVEVRLLPWAKVRSGLNNGEIDVASMYRSSFRVKEVDFAIAHEMVYHEMFIRVGAQPLQSLADCEGKQVLVEGGTYSAETLQELGFGSRLIPTPNEPTALVQLASGVGDVAIVTQTVGRPFRERLSLTSKITPSGPPVLLSEYAFAVRKGRPHLVELLNEGLNGVRASGDYDKIYDRWLKPDSSARTVRIVSWSLGVTLLITLVIFGWNRTLRQRVAAQTSALRKEYEEKESAQRALIEAERSLRRAQKMEAIGRLSGGVAHDFNNILTVILNYGQFLRETLLENRLPTTDIDQIISTSERAVRLTRQLLAFSRATPIERAPIDVCALVREMKPMLERLVGEHVQIVTIIPEASIYILAESTQVEQMLLNLSANARDAMPQGGRLTIQVASQVVPESNKWQLPIGRYVSLRVTDNGNGMDEATASQIFEPFFTTKEVGKGTGLGLATVFANMERLDGKVTVESIPGAGTSFQLFIPEAEAVTTTKAEAVVVTPTNVQAQVLVAEDDAALREATRYALERIGCVVFEACDGEDAERVFRANDKISLVITDVIMPKRTGPRLVATLRQMRPDLRVLYVSGYVQEGEALDLNAPGTAYLAKPYAVNVLVEAVCRLLA